MSEGQTPAGRLNAAADAPDAEKGDRAVDKHLRKMYYINGTPYPDIRYESEVTGVPPDVADALVRRDAARLDREVGDWDGLFE